MIDAQTIKQDIEGFQARINQAQKQLDRLPVGRLPWPEYKRRDAKRQALVNEIAHCNRLIVYASETLNELKN